jgi:peptide/nickel transport system permease protein
VAVFEPEAEGLVLDAEETGGEIVGRSPWALAGRRLLRNKLALAALALFLLIVVVSFGAPIYAHHIAHTDPFSSNVNGSVTIDGKTVPVLQQGGGKLGLGETPIGPTWRATYFLGADNQGRDVAARVLYGGRASLEIGLGSAFLACLLALFFALIAGYAGGSVDTVLSRAMDLLWAFPVYLLAISLATVLLTSHNGLQLGIISISARSLWIPLLIIGLIYIPYVYRPVRGQVLSLREKEFVEAARMVGASDGRIIRSHLLPHLVAPIVVYSTLIVASNILLEAGLSFLGIGIPLGTPSWGNLLSTGPDYYRTVPLIMVWPGLAVLLATLAFNLLGDGLRDAFDPRSAH